MTEENKKEAPAKRAKILKTVKEYVVSLLLAVLIALTIRHFIIEPFKIPSGSMIPTLLVGDFIFVNKFKYGFQIPFVRKRFVRFGEPKRGEVVVFVYPEDPKKDFIKRVVGVAGDEINFKNRTVYVNGTPVDKIIEGSYTYIHNETGAPVSGDLFVEKLGEASHYALYIDNQIGAEHYKFIPYKVPQGHMFVMGDNRDNSHDSRSWGVVPTDNLKGRALIIWLSFDKFYEKFYKKIRWDRLFTVIR